MSSGGKWVWCVVWAPVWIVSDHEDWVGVAKAGVCLRLPSHVTVGSGLRFSHHIREVLALGTPGHVVAEGGPLPVFEARLLYSPFIWGLPSYGLFSPGRRFQCWIFDACLLLLLGGVGTDFGWGYVRPRMVANLPRFRETRTEIKGS